MALKKLLAKWGLWPDTGAKAVGRGIAHAAMVGVVAGLGAIVFHLLCISVAHFSLGFLVGYEAGGPTNEMEYEDVFGDGGHREEPRIATPVNPSSNDNGATLAGAGSEPSTSAATSGHSSNILPWMLLIVPTVGGLLSGFIVYRFSPESSGHGTDAAIHAFHHNQGRIGGRVPLVKMISSALTLGTGGSGGREGPISQIGAGFGSWMATRLQLSDTDRRILMTAGLGAGIGAIFHAPLAGAMFAVEVLYRDPEFEAEALIPAFIATTVAYCVFCLAFGFKQLFTIPAGLAFDNPLLLLPLTVLAVTMLVAAWMYVKTLFAVEHAFKKVKIAPHFKPAIGAFLTGCVGVALYFAFTSAGPATQLDALSVMGIGYGYLQKVLHPENLSFLIITVLLVVGFGKILTTSLTIGSGGSAGTFGPCMVIGGTLGAVVGIFFHYLMPGVVSQTEIAVFPIVGMAAFFAAAANTPLAALLIVTEVTGGYQLLLPAMWVCAIAYIMSRGWTLYPTQVPTRLESPAHRDDFIIDVLKGLTIRKALTDTHRKFITVNLDMPLPQLARLITSTTQLSFPVVDDEEKYYGLFSLQDIRQFMYTGDVGELAVAQDLATAGLEPLTLSMDLSTAMTRFAQGRFEELPVIDAERPDKIIGMLRRQDVIAVYEKRLLEVRTAPVPSEG
ncbi:MAG: chloride channel protein [Phycisphaeraceae bacterium]